ncbi:hypothetical protein HYT32_01545 [Candidatus Roizmanbacteria bacterium]|nr:hypothetical protein [Candidatus Roizmanbacteria bacterium]
MSKRTFILIFTLFTIAFVLVIVAIYSPTTSNIPAVIPAPTLQPETLAQTDLRFGTPVKLPVAISTSEAKIVYSLPVNIAAVNNKITAVQLEMSYDSNALTEVVVTPGNFFENPVLFLNQIDDKNGRISYAIGVAPNSEGIDGEGQVATLSFQTKLPLTETTNIYFLPKTKVSGEGTNQSVLKSTNSATIVLKPDTPIKAIDN